MSLPVTIELNTNKQPFFMIPGKLHLSLQDPGPTELNPDLLSLAERGWINQAARDGVLKVINPNKKKEEVKVTKEEVPVEASRKPIVFKDLTSAAADHPEREKLVERVRLLLRGTIPQVTKAIRGSMDLLMLRTIVEQEKITKNRSKLLESVEARISILEKQLAKDLGPGDELGMSPGPGFENLPEVEDVVEREVTLRFGVDEEE